MNILLEKPDTMVSVKIPSKMRKLIDKGAGKLKVNMSQYIKIAIVAQIERDKIL